MTGELFRPFALTVTIALLSSLLVALTIVPVLAYWFLRRAEGAQARGRRRRGRGGAPLGRGGDRERSRRARASVAPAAGLPADHPLDPAGTRAGPCSSPSLVLIGTIALVPADEDELPRVDRPEHADRHADARARAPASRRKDDAAKVVEQKLLDTDGRQDRAGVDRLERQLAARRVHRRRRQHHVLGDHRPERRPGRAAEHDRERDGGDQRTTATITVSASSGFGASSDIEVDITATSDADLQKATDAVVAADLASRASIKQVTNNLSASLPYVAVEVDRVEGGRGRPQRGRGRHHRVAGDAAHPGGVGRDRQHDAEDLPAERQPADDRRRSSRSSRSRRVAGPVPLDSLATVAQAKGPATVTTAARAPHRDGHGDARHRQPGDRERRRHHGAQGRPTCRRARRRRSAASPPASRMRSRSSGSRCSRPS